MHCPFCNSDETQVLESRAVDAGCSIRRRRECAKCLKRFTTYEKVRGVALWVLKKDGRREPFDKEKVKLGVLRAVQKRPVNLEIVERVASEVEREMLKKEHEEVTSRVIGRAILKRLKKVDKVAWLRFASVYLEFNDLTDFRNAMETRKAKKYV